MAPTNTMRWACMFMQLPEHSQSCRAGAAEGGDGTTLTGREDAAPQAQAAGDGACVRGSQSCAQQPLHCRHGRGRGHWSPQVVDGLLCYEACWGSVQCMVSLVVPSPGRGQQLCSICLPADRLPAHIALPLNRQCMSEQG